MKSIQELFRRDSHAIFHAAHEFGPAPSAKCHGRAAGLGRPGQHTRASHVRDPFFAVS